MNYSLADYLNDISVDHGMSGDRVSIDPQRGQRATKTCWEGQQGVELRRIAQDARRIQKKGPENHCEMADTGDV